MRVRVLTPDQVVYDAPCEKAVAETLTGSRCFLPRHIDYVTPLRAGILVCVQSDGREVYVAIDRGVLVKQGAQITVAARQAVVAHDLEEIDRAIIQRDAEVDELTKASSRAVLQLETKLVKELMELMR